MKISKGQLRRIIREELERHLLSEKVEITVDADAPLDDQAKAYIVWNAIPHSAGSAKHSSLKSYLIYGPATSVLKQATELYDITPESAYKKLRDKVGGGIPRGAGKTVYDSAVADLVKKGATQEVAALQAALMNPSGGGRLKGMEGYERALPSALLAMARGR